MTSSGGFGSVAGAAASLEEFCNCRTDGIAATMTIDKSLKRKGRLSRARNVLKRGERIEKLKFEERWVEGQSPLGLAKTRVAKSAIGKKKKKAKEEEGEAAATPGAAAPAAAAAAPSKKK